MPVDNLTDSLTISPRPAEQPIHRVTCLLVRGRQNLRVERGTLSSPTNGP